MNAAHVASDWHRVGAGLAVRFSMRGNRFEAEWLTRPPTKREWKRVNERYRRARQAFLEPLVAERGGRAVLVLEVQP